MILETLRLLTDELNHATRGVNARLSAIPRLNGDAAPPSLALIADETRQVSAALGRLPDDPALFPCLLVSQPAAGNTLDANTKAGPLRDGHIQIVVRYGALDSDAPAATSALSYTMRAVMQCVTAWNNGTDTARTASGITALYCESMTLYPVWQPVDDKIVAGALALTFYVRDTAP